MSSSNSDKIKSNGLNFLIRWRHERLRRWSDSVRRRWQVGNQPTTAGGAYGGRSCSRRRGKASVVKEGLKRWRRRRAKLRCRRLRSPASLGLSWQASPRNHMNGRRSAHLVFKSSMCGAGAGAGAWPVCKWYCRDTVSCSNSIQPFLLEERNNIVSKKKRKKQ